VQAEKASFRVPPASALLSHSSPLAGDKAVSLELMKTSLLFRLEA
jgi:hypothetical protein